MSTENNPKGSNVELPSSFKKPLKIYGIVFLVILFPLFSGLIPVLPLVNFIFGVVCFQIYFEDFKTLTKGQKIGGFLVSLLLLTVIIPTLVGGFLVMFWGVLFLSTGF